MLSSPWGGNRRLSGSNGRKQQVKNEDWNWNYLPWTPENTEKESPSDGDLVKLVEITENNTSIFEERMQDFKQTQFYISSECTICSEFWNKM